MICNKKIVYIFEINTLLKSESLFYIRWIVAIERRVYTSCATD